MKGLPEELIYVLIFGAVLLLQYLMKRFGPQPPPPSPPPSPQDEPLPDIWGRAQTAPAAEPLSGAPPVPARGGAAPLVAAEVPRRRSGARSLLKGKQNLRRAMVLLTVLGPCRAMEPPGSAAGPRAGRAAR